MSVERQLAGFLRREVFATITLALLRIGANIVDVVAVAIIGFLSLSASQILSGDVPVLSLMGVDLVISEVNFVLITGLALGMFIFRSLMSSWVLFLVASVIAKADKKLSMRIMSRLHMSNFPENTTSSDLEGIRTVISHSIPALGSFSRSLLVLLGELSLVLMIFGFLLFQDFWLSMFLLFSASSTLFFANRQVSKRIEALAAASNELYAESNHLISKVWRILPTRVLSGALLNSADEVSNARKKSAQVSGRLQAWASLSRPMIEAGLMVSASAVTGFVLLTSDIASSIGLLASVLVGGFRIFSALVPLQQALTGIRESSTKLKPLMNHLAANQSLMFAELPEVTLNKSLIPLEVKNMSVRLADGSPFISLNQSLGKGKKLVVVGESGSGKSTLLKVLAGIRHPDSGEVLIFGQSASTVYYSALNLGVGYLGQTVPSQSENLIRNQHDDGENNAVLPELLDSLGLGSLDIGGAQSRDKGFSGGELQRFWLASVLADKPDLLFIDEPTTGLDKKSRSAVASLLDNYVVNGGTLVVSTHDELIMFGADEAIQLGNQKLFEKETFIEKNSEELGGGFEQY